MKTESKRRLPALFLSHGSPMLALQDDAYTKNLHAFCASLPSRPRAVVIVSAHGLSPDGEVEVSASTKPHLVYDFRGFPAALYQIEYPCPGSPGLAAEVAGLLAGAGFSTSLDATHGLDHGVWIPLRIAFPEADIPVIQVTMPYPSRPESVLKLGKALAPLREQGVLLVGSGGMVHNLGKLAWHQKEGAPAPWAQRFDDWVFECLERKDVAALCDFEGQAPDAKLAHPAAEHFFPIFFVLGASLMGDSARVLHREIQYETLSMSCFALNSDGSEPGQSS